MTEPLNGEIVAGLSGWQGAVLIVVTFAVAGAARWLRRHQRMPRGDGHRSAA